MTIISESPERELPEDVLFHILLCLPVASLVRFKAVCKAWCALIQTPAFIDQHTQHHRHLNNHNLLIVDSGVPPGRIYCRPLRFFSIAGAGADNNYHQHPPVHFQLDYPCFEEFSENDVDMVTCNGLVCLHIRDASYVSSKLNVCLWNPATRKLRALPQSPVPPPLYSYAPGISIGFGFDAKTNDYKVVRIVTVRGHPNLTRAEVYSLNTDSWTTVDSVLPVFDIIKSNPKAPLHQNGLYCWSAAEIKNPPNLSPDFILSFDFSEEVFGTMSLPDEDPEAHVRFDYRPQLAIIKDNLACITKKLPPGSEFLENPILEIYEIWMLNNYGVKESWTKLFKFSLEAGVSHLSNNGTSLFFLKDRFHMFNIFTQEIKDLPGTIFRQADGMLPFAEYMDSLVSVESGNGRAMSPTCVVPRTHLEQNH